MTDPFKVLAELEERVKKAEEQIPALQKKLADTETERRTEALEAMRLSEKLKKYEELATTIKDVFGLASRDSLSPPVSTGATGSIEVADPVRLIQVEELQEPLKVDTTQLRGQIAKLIVEGRIDSTLVNAKGVRGKLVAEFGSAGEAWDIDTVLKELKTLAAPPFRLFSFSPKNYMFRLRTGSEKRVKE